MLTLSSKGTQQSDVRMDVALAADNVFLINLAFRIESEGQLSHGRCLLPSRPACLWWGGFIPAYLFAAAVLHWLEFATTLLDDAHCQG